MLTGLRSKLKAHPHEVVSKGEQGSPSDFQQC